MLETLETCETKHLTDDVIQGFLMGILSPADRRELHSHRFQCRHCHERLLNAEPPAYDDSVWQAILDAATAT